MHVALDQVERSDRHVREPATQHTANRTRHIEERRVHLDLSFFSLLGLDTDTLQLRSPLKKLIYGQKEGLETVVVAATAGAWGRHRHWSLEKRGEMD